MSEEKRTAVRNPKAGKQSVYMNLEDLEALELLKGRWGVGMAEAIRRAVRKAIRYNMDGGDE